MSVTRKNGATCLTLYWKTGAVDRGEILRKVSRGVSEGTESLGKIVGPKSRQHTGATGANSVYLAWLGMTKSLLGRGSKRSQGSRSQGWRAGGLQNRGVLE